jgi:ribonucleoside-diphosphate reductase alpha chain
MAQLTTLGTRRFFTTEGTKAYDLLDWQKRDSRLENPKTGEVVFEQKDLEFPTGWSQNAVNIVAQKYFCGTPGTPEREGSLKTLINRVADTVAEQGYKEGYFDTEEETEDFVQELKYILATQRAAFNSPVWFNIGAKGRAQQASACFILGIEDTMPSILNWYKEEGMIFKGGSGAGINLSVLRSSKEQLGGSAGTASGPLSFMRGADASAGAIKSGGKTRRAAKMVVLNIDHPDIEEFVWCKSIEERKARVLRDAGFDMSLDGKDMISVQYQNANNSVRVSDDFMEAVIAGKNWDLKAVTNGTTVKTVSARDLMHQVAQSAWECADPGIQYDTTINKWHTSPNAGRINASNPCSEYMHLDDSACNLSSINLLKYLGEDGTFDVDAFKHTVETMFIAQEIFVGYSSYPTESITKNARAYRELGLGYANLGALLMAQGHAYDSNEGRSQAAAITALMTGHAYATSARMARRVGPFAGFHKDRDAMIKVLKMHRSAVGGINPSLVAEDLLSAAANAWNEAVEMGESYGVRNSQATVLAPTGTIGLMMDCDTTGIEPDLGLVKFKKLVGGGSMTIVNQTVPRALRTMGYKKSQVDDIVAYIDKEKTIAGAPHLKTEHHDVFSCSMGDNPIHYMGHVKMMAAAQPFLSGAISKTVNMPESASVEDIENLLIESWRLGLKAVAIYRDNCKVGQPLSMMKKGADKNNDAIVSTTTSAILDTAVVKVSKRRELPNIRPSKTFGFRVADARGYFTVGEYADGKPGELFITVAKMGSTLAGIMDAFATSVSFGLQYGVPLKTYVKKMTNMSFAPAGITDDKEIRTATSLVDYIFKRMALSYLSFDERLELGLASIDDMPDTQMTLIESATPSDLTVPGAAKVEKVATPHIEKPKPEAKSVRTVIDESAPMCYNCGNHTQKAGSCYVCTSCGSTTGCS